MRRDATLARELSGAGSAGARASVTIPLGVALWLGGESDEALVVLDQGAKEGQVVNVLVQISAAGFAALVLADLGRWTEAREHAVVASRLVDELELAGGSGRTRAARGARLLSPHRGPQARRLHSGHQGCGSSLGLPHLLTLIAEVVVAESLFESGDVTSAARWMREGLASLATWPDAGILRDRLQRLKECVDERRVVDPLTPAELRVLAFLSTQLSLPEIGRRLFLSRATIKTHTQHIYRKLGVSGRTEAVERARSLGNLPAAH